MRPHSTTWLATTLMASCVGFWAASVSPLLAVAESVNQVNRLEVRLAEKQPAAGLVEASVTGGTEKIYLHREILITNADVAQARVVPGSGALDFSVTVTFTREGAAKLAQATASHINKPIAILIDGQVVTAPTLRGQVSDSAVIAGEFSGAQAAAIAAGLNQK